MLKIGIILSLVFILCYASFASAEENLIPEWIKKNAGWWANDQISESEFLNSMSYLKTKGIIDVTKQPAKIDLSYLALENDVSTKLDEKNYKKSKLFASIHDAIKNPLRITEKFVFNISGELENKKPRQIVFVNILNPDGKTNEISTASQNQGFYSKDMYLDSEILSGIYRIQVIHEEKIIETSYLYLEGKSELVPVWIKNNAGWWAEDKISDKDFISGMKYLMENDLLDINEKQDEQQDNEIAQTFFISVQDLSAKAHETRQQCIDRVVKSGTSNSAEISKCKRLSSEIREEELKFFDDPNFSALDSQTLPNAGTEPSRFIKEILTSRGTVPNQNFENSGLSSATSREECRKLAMENDGVLDSREINICANVDRRWIDIHGTVTGSYPDSLSPEIEPDYYGGYRSYDYYSPPKNYDKPSYSYNPSYNYDYSNQDSSYHYDDYNYGYYNYNYDFDADVNYLLKRADHFANRAVGELDVYANQFVNGQMSYNEYERKGMAIMDYYSNLYVNDFNNYFNSKYPYP